MSHTYTVCKSCRGLNKVDSEKALKAEAICGKCGQPLGFHGLVSSVTGAELMRIVKKADQPVIVDFWAAWCGPCKMYGPIFEEASKKYKNATFLKVDTEADPGISGQLGIRGIPTTIVFKNGQEAKRQSGALPLEMIGSLL
ncbi:MAG: thioredoxin TrxC [Pseudobdellovibrionaceae bacterium]|nr:thioredoxin TrxC [Bdellovibrionales bacterium]USN46383.1 MAG: thioredoxin TrxC [Pseudobdellovibrionaceae bacterium]